MVVGADALGIVLEEGVRVGAGAQEHPLAGALSAAGRCRAIELALHLEALERPALAVGLHDHPGEVSRLAQEADQEAGPALVPRRAEDAAGVHLERGALPVDAGGHVPRLAGARNRLAVVVVEHAGAQRRGHAVLEARLGDHLPLPRRAAGDAQPIGAEGQEREERVEGQGLVLAVGEAHAQGDGRTALLAPHLAHEAEPPGGKSVLHDPARAPGQRHVALRAAAVHPHPGGGGRRPAEGRGKSALEPDARASNSTCSATGGW